MAVAGGQAQEEMIRHPVITARGEAAQSEVKARLVHRGLLTAEGGAAIGEEAPAALRGLKLLPGAE